MSYFQYWEGNSKINWKENSRMRLGCIAFTVEASKQDLKFVKMKIENWGIFVLSMDIQAGKIFHQDWWITWWFLASGNNSSSTMWVEHKIQTLLQKLDWRQEEKKTQRMKTDTFLHTSWSFQQLCPRNGSNCRNQETEEGILSNSCLQWSALDSEVKAQCSGFSADHLPLTSPARTTRWHLPCWPVRSGYVRSLSLVRTFNPRIIVATVGWRFQIIGRESAQLDQCPDSLTLLAQLNRIASEWQGNHDVLLCFCCRTRNPNQLTETFPHLSVVGVWQVSGQLESDWPQPERRPRPCAIEQQPTTLTQILHQRNPVNPHLVGALLFSWPNGPLDQWTLPTLGPLAVWLGVSTRASLTVLLAWMVTRSTPLGGATWPVPDLSSHGGLEFPPSLGVPPPEFGAHPGPCQAGRSSRCRRRKRRTFLANFQSPFDGWQSAVLTQTKQNGHWWVPLFASFSLCHFVLGPHDIFPNINGRWRTEPWVETDFGQTDFVWPNRLWSNRLWPNRLWPKLKF